MAPPVYAFPASQLPEKIQQGIHGRRRKMEKGVTRIDLDRCQLFQTLQYECVVKNPDKRDSPVVCTAVPRFFRRCRDKKGIFTVETTAIEKLNE